MVRRQQTTNLCLRPDDLSLDFPACLWELVRGGNVVSRQRRPGAEEEILHLLHKELLRLRQPGLEAVPVQQHLLAAEPLVPWSLGHVLIDLLAKLRVEGRLVEGFHFLLVANAKNHVRHKNYSQMPL